jgi:hypothetical protein
VFHVPGIKDYYGRFFNDLAINEKIVSSQFASNFPNILVSGYWDGLPDHPIYIFEYLGREVPEKSGIIEKYIQLSSQSSRSSIC